MTALNSNGNISILIYCHDLRLSPMNIGIKETRTFANDELKRSFILAVLLDKLVLDIIGMYY